MTLSSVRVRPAQVFPEQQAGQPVAHTSPLELHTSRCVKYTMFFKNMFFLLCGVLLGAIGVVALQEKNKLNGKFDDLFLDPAAILLSVGVVTFIISFCGALGALRENKCLLRFFYTCLIIIIILEIALAVAFYAYRNKIRRNVDDIFQEMISKYHDDPDLEAVVDYVQKEVKCCGSLSLNDWSKNPYYNCSNKAIVSSCSVPYSCCKKDKMNRRCGGGVLSLSGSEQEDKVYTTSCLKALEDWIMDHLLYVGIACGCLLILQLIAVRLAFSLISDINEIIKWRDSQ